MAEAGVHTQADVETPNSPGLLFTPIDLGPLTVSNRIFFAPHSTHYSDQIESERHTAYYEARAAGGAGLIVHEPVVVHETSISRRGKIWGFDDRNIEPFRRTTEAVHRHGTRIVCQIIHNGAQMTSYESGEPLWSASATRSPSGTEISHEMTVSEIRRIVEGFGATAAICEAGGFDGVEIHGAHGYLVQAFLSPLTNRRDDAYGGSEELRLRFLREIITMIRSQVGERFVVGLRISGDELEAGGLGSDDMQRIVRHLHDRAPVDYLSVVAGSHRTYDRVVPDLTHPLGVNVGLAAAIRSQARGTPVLVAGRIAEPEHAESILSEGSADMIGLARAMIADPSWPRKARDRKSSDIRPCIYTNECRSAIDGLRPVACSVNPGAGHERESSGAVVNGFERGAAPLRVLIVGAGPAGLHAAATLAEAGCETDLVDEAERVGGQLRSAAAVPSRRDLFRIIDHLEGRYLTAGGRLRLGERVEAAAVAAGGHDAVVFAAGGEPVRVEAPDEGRLRASDVLGGLRPTGRRVLVVDAADNGWSFVSTIELLLADGHEVTAVTPAPVLAGGIDRASQPPLWRRLFSAGLEVKTLRTLDRFDGVEAVLRHRFGGSTEVVSMDAVVVEAGVRARTELIRACDGFDVPRFIVGDAAAPRRIIDAIRDGESAARSIIRTSFGVHR